MRRIREELWFPYGAAGAIGVDHPQDVPVAVSGAPAPAQPPVAPLLPDRVAAGERARIANESFVVEDLRDDDPKGDGSLWGPRLRWGKLSNDAYGIEGYAQDGTRTAAAFGDPFATYAPAWTSNGTAPSLGNGTLTGRYFQVGKQTHVHIDLFAGSTTTYGTGAWLFSLPVSLFSTGLGYTGIGRAFDSSASGSYGLFVNGNSSSTIALFTPAAPAVFVGNTAPFIWATGDALSLDFIYEAA